MITVMKYKINNTVFTFKEENLWINDKPIELKHATLKTLQLFIQSNGDIISKDNILDNVWENVIVSDSSVFKQIELVRKLFKKSGLPKDTIHNVYGKGYKIKYDIIKVNDNYENDQESTIFEADVKSDSLLKYSLGLFLLVVLSFILYFSGLFNQTIKPNYLDKSKRDSMVSLMNNNWKEGLLNIESVIENNNKRLSIDDLAFLYGKKGRAQYYLQEYTNSVDSYSQALKFYYQTGNKKQTGQVHLNLSSSLNSLPQNKESYATQLKHINTAIELFQQSESTIEMIDAQIVLAHLYQKYNKIDKTIALFEKTITDANKINDATGAMIANNNLASAHLMRNDYDKAIELGQIGLDMALKIGKGRYIASSYSFLSDLYQSQYRSSEAIDMIQQAIKHQLTNQEFANLSPKITNLEYILVQTYQHEKADELLKLAEKYAQFLKMNNGVSIISLYMGLNEARQYNWIEAEKHLTEALKISQRINFKYKQPLSQAYLSLTHFFNNNNLQAIEKATHVLNNNDSDKQSKAIAALSLAYVYTFIEKTELADQWFQRVEELQNPKWLFEYQLFLKLKLERQNDSILAVQTQKEIQDVQTKMQKLAQSAKVNEDIFQDLVTQITEKIQAKTPSEK